MYSDNNRIAKNTIILYFRMIVSLSVSLYTSRVILHSLGVVDYGIYNVVGGIVTCMSFMLQSLVVSFQRFFCKYIPSGNNEMQSRILGSAIMLVLLISFIAFLFVETVGVWFLNNKLSVPNNRLASANVVLQFTLVIFIISLFQSVYNSIIISYERMNLYAYISLFEVFAKLAVAWGVSAINYDKLISYSALLTFVAVLSFAMYYVFVKCNYKKIHPVFSLKSNKYVVKEIFSFSGMSMIGTVSHVAKNTGIGFLLNIYFGPIVNAARAISFQIYTAVSSFTQSFQTAFSPNMMKQFGVVSSDETERVLYAVSKFSFYAMLILSFPIIISIDSILEIWLQYKSIPEYTDIFSILILLIGLLDTLSTPIVNVIYASGRINGFLCSLSLVVLLSLPVIYILLELGFSPTMVYCVDLIVALSAQVVRIIYLHKIIKSSFSKYFINVICPISKITIISFVCWLVSYMVDKSILIQFLMTVAFEVVVLISIIYIGLSKKERLFIQHRMKSYVSKHRKI